MLGSNRPSDSQAEGCVEALGDFRLSVPGGNPLLGDGFFFARLPWYGPIRIT